MNCRQCVGPMALHLHVGFLLKLEVCSTYRDINLETACAGVCFANIVTICQPHILFLQTSAAAHVHSSML